MPNHVKNMMTISGASQDVIDFVFSLIKNQDDGSAAIDFKSIIPPPAFMFHDDCGQKHEELADKIGVLTWVQWTRKHWGTKWNAYRASRTGNTIQFETAWMTPEPIYKALIEKFHMLNFDIVYADEDTGYNTGRITGKNGKISWFTCENGSVDAYENAFLLRPDLKEYYKLVDGVYKSVEY